jgi:hypothetical protein
MKEIEDRRQKTGESRIEIEESGERLSVNNALASKRFFLRYLFAGIFQHSIIPNVEF